MLAYQNLFAGITEVIFPGWDADDQPPSVRIIIADGGFISIADKELDLLRGVGEVAVVKVEIFLFAKVQNGLLEGMRQGIRGFRPRLPWISPGRSSLRKRLMSRLA